MATYRDVALEETRYGVAPQVERGSGGRGECDSEQQGDTDEAGGDVRRAAAYVLARRGTQRRGEPREQPAW
eukprot:scaffold71167_cov58-Phaeocystis_antarctica.AAC.3